MCRSGICQANVNQEMSKNKHHSDHCVRTVTGTLSHRNLRPDAPTRPKMKFPKHALCNGLTLSARGMQARLGTMFIRVDTPLGHIFLSIFGESWETRVEATSMASTIIAAAYSAEYDEDIHKVILRSYHFLHQISRMRNQRGDLKTILVDSVALQIFIAEAQSFKRSDPAPLEDL